MRNSENRRLSQSHVRSVNEIARGWKSATFLCVRSLGMRKQARLILRNTEGGSPRCLAPSGRRRTLELQIQMTSTAAIKAALTRKRKAAARKAATTRKKRGAALKAARTKEAVYRWWESRGASETSSGGQEDSGDEEIKSRGRCNREPSADHAIRLTEQPAPNQSCNRADLP